MSYLYNITVVVRIYIPTVSTWYVYMFVLWYQFVSHTLGPLNIHVTKSLLKPVTISFICITNPYCVSHNIMVILQVKKTKKLLLSYHNHFRHYHAYIIRHCNLGLLFTNYQRLSVRWSHLTPKKEKQKTS